MRERKTYGLNGNERTAYAAMVRRRGWNFQDYKDHSGQSLTVTSAGVELALNVVFSDVLRDETIVTSLDERMDALLEELRENIEE
ncbi:MAG: hypothetical protein CMH62_00050 [Nanoarchaeota archaeon]|nr:hypothetical protein [Nanoarchaeota archaeon]|tara:strand:+ start:924 stop:1178 length:255 start_codon:yes stop_codon:yes gene_type:complete